MRTLKNSYTYWDRVLLKWWIWDLNPGTLCSSPLTYEASYLFLLALTRYMKESEHHHFESKDTKGMYLPNIMERLGFPGGTGSKEPACQWRRRERCSFDPWMATHSSIVVWRTPWTEELGGIQSMGSQRVRHDWAQHRWFYVFSMELNRSFFLC